MAAHPFRLKQKKKEACTRLVARFPMPVAGFPQKRVFSILGIANNRRIQTRNRGIEPQFDSRGSIFA